MGFEIVLFIVILIFLFVIRTDLKTRFDTIDKKLLDVNRRLEYLRKQSDLLQPPIENEASPTTATPTPKPIVPVQPILPETPVPVVPPPIPTIIAAENKPPVATPAEPKEKTVVPTTVHAPQPISSKPEAPKVSFPPPAYVPRKSWWATFKENNPDLEKFIGENLINKIGILILALGISYLVKLGIDQNVITEPMRVGIGVLSGGLVMVFAHRLRKNYKAFSSVLVAGAISIFYFTIAIAFHDYHLINQTTAFIIMVLITLFSTFISIAYDRVELAVLSLIGAFAVPFIVSTGEGNYIVLLTYIAIIDIGMLIVAYFKKWHLVNILAYIFTVLLYGGWLISIVGETNAPYTNALIYGFVFYFIFILMNIANNLRVKGEFSNTQLTVLISNTFLFYTAGIIILEHSHPGYKGLFTTVLAFFNLFYAWFLYKKFRFEKKVIYLLIGLTLSFATLAIPIQFQGNQITLFWAAEAVLLLWLSQKSKINTFRFASVVVHALMLISLLMDWSKIYQSDQVLNIVVNPAFLTGIFGIASYYCIIRLLKNESENSSFYGLNFDPKIYSRYVEVLTLLLLYCAGFIEVAYQANDYLQSSNASAAVIVLYHMLFSVIFIQFYSKDKSSAVQNFASALAVANILLFVFLFSLFAFREQTEYVTGSVHFRLAYLLHWITLGLCIWFFIYLFKKDGFLAKFGQRELLLAGSFLLVYFASSELMLHSIAASVHVLTGAEIHSILAKNQYDYPSEYALSQFAYNTISQIKNQVVRTGFPILWGTIAFIFLIIGIRKQLKALRIIALVLLGITILKLFLYDIRNASETGKIIAFILLGILILVISFVYQKLKVLVLSDANKQKQDNENNA